MNLAELEKKAKELKERGARNRKKSYKLAKALGFSTNEAIILQHRNEETIRRLAEERIE